MKFQLVEKNEKFKKYDFIIRVGKDMILNLELNKNSYSELLIKNLSYVFNLFSTATKKRNNYNKNLKIIEININCFKDKFYDKNIPLTDFKLSNIESNEVLTDSLIIYMLNVVKSMNYTIMKKTKKYQNTSNGEHL